MGMQPPLQSSTRLGGMPFTKQNEQRTARSALRRRRVQKRQRISRCHSDASPASSCASPPFSLPHFMPLHFTSRFVRLTSLHFMPLCFPSRFVCLTSRHFMPLHAASHYFYLTSHHFISPPVLSASLHATSLRLQFFLPHFMPLHSTSPPFFSPHFASPHLTSSHLSAYPANFTIFANDSDIRKIQLW